MAEMYGSAIYWHETSRADPRPTLDGDLDVDVAIIGGGYTGLWTAYHLLAEDPGLRVVILEREAVGFGASGRNGGFAMTLLDLSLDLLRRNHGDDDARLAHEAVAASVDAIGATIETEGIECEWRHGGLLMVATNPGQLERLERDRVAAEELGLAGFTRLSASETQAEVHSPTYLAGLREDHCGVLHPAKLARGLARAVEARGGVIHEHTAVTDITETTGGAAPGSVTGSVTGSAAGLRVVTERGTVRASQVVLATNAWAAHQRWVGRRVVPLYTYIALTEPLSDEQWDSVGWDSHCGIEDKRNFVHYYRRTLDGRILWGGSDGIIHYGGRIAPRHDRHGATLARLRRTFDRTFPQLAGVRFTHHWGGPVGITTSLVPVFGTLLEGRLHYGVGYNGHGVAPSHTGGLILRDKVMGRDSDLTKLCFVDRRAVPFPPEPVCWLASEATRRSLLRQDSGLDRGQPEGDAEPATLRFLRRLA